MSVWFKTWFDSPYYHVLYRNRNYEEAKRFITNLISFLKPQSDAKMLDLACGSGRHSIFLAKMGYEVYGIDLSENSIKKAKKHEKASLHFDIHDMRKVYKAGFFDYEISLFTSLGYFENEEDNLATFDAINKNLKNRGFLIIDFLNAKRTIMNLMKEETKVVDDIEFNIKRSYADKVITKTITFQTGEGHEQYQEKVMAFTLDDFKSYFDRFNFSVIEVFGSYNLKPYDEDVSKRLIIIARKEDGTTYPG